MKFKALVLAIALTATVLVGCGAKEEAPAKNDTVETGTETEETTDVVTTASLVDSNEAFVSAIGSEGTWIIATLNDLTIDQELVLEGEFRDKNDPTKDLKRKIALYTQDADRNVTARFSLTAPKLTIKSPNALIQGGTFVGDIYVEAENFKVVDATVEGNIYFASEELKATFVTEKEGKVTGVTEVK